MSDLIHVEIVERINRIRINRPDKKNALNLAMYDAMTAAVENGEKDDQVRVHFFTGTDSSFTSGNDLADFMQSPPTSEDSPVGRFLNAIVTAKKPIVAAVNGLAIGVGTTMLLHFDLVYAAESARFSLPFTNLGLCAEAGSSMLLPRMIGHQRAAELLLLGEMFDAQTAKEASIVNKVFADADLQENALAQARKLAALPPNAIRVTKGLMKRSTEAELTAAMRAEMTYFMEMLTGPEAMEAMSAFMQRRKPDFSQFS